jgi:hypothetical protein
MDLRFSKSVANQSWIWLNLSLFKKRGKTKPKPRQNQGWIWLNLS